MSTGRCDAVGAGWVTTARGGGRAESVDEVAARIDIFPARIGGEGQMPDSWCRRGLEPGGSGRRLSSGAGDLVPVLEEPRGWLDSLGSSAGARSSGRPRRNGLTSYATELP